jgi:hypothetical protein
VQYVPGVVVSGFLPHAEGASAAFTIGGAAAASGHVTIASGGRVTGRLGGRRVSTTFASRAAAAGGATGQRSGRAQPQGELLALVPRTRLAPPG